MALLIPVSWGELLDKMSILEIKFARISDGAKRRNIGHELRLLGEVVDNANLPGTVDLELIALKEDLRRVNEALWDIEDAIRQCESSDDFGPRFVELARSVYKKNDRRAALKLRINHLLGSDLVEEKSYRPY